MSATESRSHHPYARQIPNFLTCCRFGLGIAFPWVSPASRIGLVAAALVTELLDGSLARRFGWESRAGRILDPIADKVFFLLVMGTFLAEHHLSWLELLALGFRDLMVGIGTLAAILAGGRRRVTEMRPTRLGKLTTALQYVAFLMLVVGMVLPWVLTATTFALGAWAAFRYRAEYLRSSRALGAEVQRRKAA